MKPANRKANLRCAVYTRVSTEHGLEQEFNSLDNQREASEAYIKSQAHAMTGTSWNGHRFFGLRTPDPDRSAMVRRRSGIATPLRRMPGAPLPVSVSRARFT